MKRFWVVMAVLTVGLLAGCSGGGNSDDADVSHHCSDRDPRCCDMTWSLDNPCICYPSMCDGSDDTDVGADADADSDGDADTELVDCVGGKYDPSSGLCWQNPPADTSTTWNGAVSYCDNLSLGEYVTGSWHLPTISELRSLIRGCPGTETGGTCGVTDACMDGSCSNTACAGCALGAGPGESGYYSPLGIEFAGSIVSAGFWSSSDNSSDSSTFIVGFNDGDIRMVDKTDPYPTYRCVRPGP